MSLTVETGAVVPSADSYVTLAVYQAYGAARGWTLGDADADDEANLVRAYDAINRLWVYRGEQVNEDVQTGEFPRYIIKNRFEYVAPADEVPQRVKDAQCELAYLIQGGLNPFATIEANTTGEMVKVGPITVDETTTGTGKPRLVAVEGLLRPYLLAGAGQVALTRG
ncbi:DnaT-like ssDNA-binding protein [Maritimibacter sp. UBA3975]|uniref:DnaT-like ssDNA-binding protein n=1 Tax=Maritimibacter sp. UBA3975 TaxID=1946833 RepID=UPI000C0AE5F9|nr:DnaT-like ssDNA-binding protein [Maritimibacter sp. UBA3975]MAM60858.1 hypothetical protein [Maritimibacter sp.]|tara:strand:+ start:12651 stop:13151 length:501 start_codon:yes stop_codon:yes gene_type:complete